MSQQSINEIDFCGQVASEVNFLTQKDPNLAPIHEARIEGYGKQAGRRKRKDLRFYDHEGKLILCGEVKLPGTFEGRSPYSAEFCNDAAQKADNAGVRYFFTWNVNTFVLWDRSLWDRPFLDRRVREWRLERSLRNPEEVSHEDNLPDFTLIYVHYVYRGARDSLFSGFPPGPCST